MRVLQIKIWSRKKYDSDFGFLTEFSLLLHWCYTWLSGWPKRLALSCSFNSCSQGGSRSWHLPDGIVIQDQINDALFIALNVINNYLDIHYLYIMVNDTNNLI